jgi:hypothetical protein
MTMAMSGTMSIPVPGIPVLEKPMSTAHRMTMVHSIVENSSIVASLA